MSLLSFEQWPSKFDNWGGGSNIHSQTIKTIDFREISDAAGQEYTRKYNTLKTFAITY